MADTSAPVYNPPISGGVTEGGAVSGGTANTLLRVDGSGNVDSWAGSHTDSSDRIAFGADAPDVLSGIFGGGRESVVQVIKEDGVNDTGFYSRAKNSAGGGGYFAYCGGTLFEFMAWGPSKAGTQFGRNRAGAIGLTCSNGPLIIGPTTAHDVVIGKAITYTPTAIADSNTTIASAQGNTVYTSLSANRVATLPAANALGNGLRLTVSARINAMGGFRVDVTRAGADTINGAATAYALDVAWESVTLETDGVSNWQVVGTS